MELGAPYTSAVITIKMSPGYDFWGTAYYYFYMKPAKTTDKFYIPSMYDFQ